MLKYSNIKAFANQLDQQQKQIGIIKESEFVNKC